MSRTTVPTSQQSAAVTSPTTSSSQHEFKDQEIKINESTHLGITIRWPAPAVAEPGNRTARVDLDSAVLIMIGGADQC